jgi:hypothetical protein
MQNTSKTGALSELKSWKENHKIMPFEEFCKNENVFYDESERIDYQLALNKTFYKKFN